MRHTIWRTWVRGSSCFNNLSWTTYLTHFRGDNLAKVELQELRPMTGQYTPRNSRLPIQHLKQSLFPFKLRHFANVKSSFRYSDDLMKHLPTCLRLQTTLDLNVSIHDTINVIQKGIMGHFLNGERSLTSPRCNRIPVGTCGDCSSVLAQGNS